MKTLLLLPIFGIALFLNPTNQRVETLTDLPTWLEGHWKGEAFGGFAEEMWSSAADGTMMGMYRNVVDGDVRFYEFMLLDSSGMKIKHFNPDMTGWEDKGEWVHFAMIRCNGDELILEGLRFYRRGEDELDIEIELESKGEITTHTFHMRRK